MKLKYVFLILAGASSYGILSTFVAKAYADGLSLAQVSGGQMLSAAFMLWILSSGVWLRTKNRSGLAMNLPDCIKSLVVGAMTGVTGMLYYASIQYTTASLAIVLLFQFTWMGVLLEAFLIRKKPTNDQLYSLLILFAGTLLAAGFIDHGPSQFPLKGLILGLLSALSYTVFLVFSAQVAVHIHPVKRSAVMITGAILIIFLVLSPRFLWNPGLDGTVIKYSLLLGFFGGLFPTLCIVAGASKVGGALTSILSAIELPAAVVMAVIFLNEQVSILQWLGVVLIVAGVAMPEVLTWYRERLKK